jgi:SAM-dependent methyltransferase
MQPDENIKHWANYWQSSKGLFDDMSDMEQAESWNKRWGRPDSGLSKQTMHEKKQERVKEIFDFLREVGFDVKGSRVLDIGSGPGATSIPFAKAGAAVTSLDISSTALERLQVDAKKEGVSIDTIECSWWSADIDALGFRNAFDLVFVTNTPAVKDAAGFNRVIGCSRKFCFYNFFISGSPMQWAHQDVLQKLFNKQEPQQRTAKGSLFMNGFMYLYLMDYRPLIRIKHNRRNIEVGWEEAADHAIRSLERFEPCTTTMKAKIRQYYATVAVEGMYHAEYEGYSGMMVWTVSP